MIVRQHALARRLETSLSPRRCQCFAERSLPIHSYQSWSSINCRDLAPILCSKDYFDVVAVWIENECSIVDPQSQTRSAIVDPACDKRSLMKGLNLLPASTTKRSMLLDVIRMKNIDPEYGIVDTICHPAQIQSVRVSGFEVPCGAPDDPNTERSERCFIEYIRPMDVRYANPSMVDKLIALVSHSSLLSMPQRSLTSLVPHNARAADDRIKAPQARSRGTGRRAYPVLFRG